MKKILLVAILLLCAGSDQPIPDQIASLHARVSALETEVKELRKLIEPQRQSATAVQSDRVIQLIAIETIPTDQMKIVEAEALESEADALEKQAQEHDEDYAKTADSKIKTNNPNVQQPSTKARREFLRSAALECRSKAKDKRSLANRLRREAGEPRQLIVGWDGAREVTLETERDLSGSITQLQPGDFVTWYGKRVELTGDSQRFRVTRIERAHKPIGFKEVNP